ncbi:unnamed protein product [Umbelopsis sp. WA50703]
MWALGCVLYTLLCGFPPFYDESIQILTQKVAKGEYEFLSPWWDDISSEAKDLISHLLTVNADERYTIVQFLDHPWIKNVPAKSSHAKEHVVLANKQNIIEQEEEKITESAASSPTLGALRMTPLAHEKSDGTIISPRPIKKPGDQPITDNTRRNDVASPTFTSMKEVFDVSYAVHRMAEEKARRKALAANPKAQTAVFGAIHAMNDIDEDGNDDDDGYGLTTDNSDSSQSADSSEESEIPAPESREVNNAKVQMDNLKLKNPPSQRLQQAQRERLVANLKGAAKIPTEKPKPSSKMLKKSPFELKIGNATLLEKRKQRQQMPDPPAVQG